MKEIKTVRLHGKIYVYQLHRILGSVYIQLNDKGCIVEIGCHLDLRLGMADYRIESLALPATKVESMRHKSISEDLFYQAHNVKALLELRSTKRAKQSGLKLIKTDYEGEKSINNAERCDIKED